MQYARATIAAMLATGLIIIVIIKESLTDEFWTAIGASPEVVEAAIAEDVAIDSTFFLMGLIIIILIVPDAIAAIRGRKTKEKEDDGTDT